MVLAASMALMIASSVACTVASYTGSIRSSPQHRHRLDAALSGVPTLGGREGDEEIARARARDPAHAPDAQRGAPGHPAELVRQQGRVGCDHDDDRALLLLASVAAAGQRCAAWAESRSVPS